MILYVYYTPAPLSSIFIILTLINNKINDIGVRGIKYMGMGVMVGFYCSE